MSYMIWNRKAFRIGIKAFDDEHRHILLALNELCAAVAASDKSAMRLRMRELKQRLIAHLDHEEELMRRNRYPRYEQHKKAHDSLRADLRRTERMIGYFRDRDMALLQLSHFGYAKLGHILTTDALYEPFFRETPPESGRAHRSAA